MDEIDELLILSQSLDDAAKLFSLVADDDHVRIAQHAVDSGAHQLRNVRYLALDVFLVRADESRERNVAVVQRELESFADQRFDQRHHRRLAQIVRAGFETKTEYADAFVTRLDHHVDRALNL